MGLQTLRRTNIKSGEEHEVNESKLHQRHKFDLSELMLDPPLAHCLTSRYTTGTLMLLPKLHWALLNSTNAICTGDGKNRFARKLVLAHCLTYTCNCMFFPLISNWRPVALAMITLRFRPWALLGHHHLISSRPAPSYSSSSFV